MILTLWYLSGISLIWLGNYLLREGYFSETTDWCLRHFLMEVAAAWLGPIVFLFMLYALYLQHSEGAIKSLLDYPLHTVKPKKEEQ